MALESATYLHQLSPANPPGSDRVHQGDDHLRLIKQVLQNTFPNIKGPVTASHEQLNAATGYGTPIGVIAIWYGAGEDVPVGWAICNGQTVPKTDGSGNITTPDLRGYVVMGVSTAYTVGQTLGSATVTATTSSAGGHTHTGTAATAGGHNHTGKVGGTALSVSQMPKHKHANGVTDAQTSSVFSRGYTSAATTTTDSIDANSDDGRYEGWTEEVGGGQAHDHSINTDGAHTHSITMNNAGEHQHSLGSISVMQPTMALHYIMKV